MKPSLAPALAILIAAIPSTLSAEEPEKLTIEPTGFVIRESFTARAFPSDPVPVSIDAKSWSAFEITDIAPHGASVEKGDILIAFDPADLLQRIEDLERAVAKREHEIASATLELTNLKETAEERLAASRRAATEAADDHEYHIGTRHAIDLESSDQALKRAEQRLRNANEELVQLKRMYEADDLVEETEEIILARAHESVEAAEFALRVETLEHARRRETTMPRQIQSLVDAKKETARKLATDEEEIPRAITLKEAALAVLGTTQARERETLAQLTADRELLEIKAPADGTIYHGTIENGEWTTGDLLRALVVGGSPPVKRQLATFIPADAALTLHAQLEESTARSIGNENPGGLAILTGREDVSIPVTVASISPVPTPALRHHAVITAEWPDGQHIAPGTSAEIHLITYANENAILVPAKALGFGTDGWEVEVKLADGKTQKRNVTRGRAHGGKVEILDGLEAGQVIVLP